MQDNMAQTDMTGSNEPSLDDLAYSLDQAKRTENAAKADRLNAETRLIELGNPERHPTMAGSKTTTGERYKVTLKDEPMAKLQDRKIGFREIYRLCEEAGVTIEDMPVKTTVEVDVKKLDAIKKRNPELYFMLIENAGIERYQAKTSVTIKEV